MTTFTETDSFGIGAHDGLGPIKSSALASDLTRLHDHNIWAWGTPLHSGVGMHQTSAPQWVFAAEIDAIINMQAGALPVATYHQLLTNVVKLHDALGVIYPLALSSGIGLHDVRTVLRAIIVFEGLGLATVASPTLNYHLTIAQFIKMNDVLARFLGASLIQGMGVHAALSDVFVANPILTAGLGIHLSETHQMVFRIIDHETIHLHDSDILQAIFAGTLGDGVQITGAHLTPSGTFTTWAVNTRTGSVTEYRNWVFNSFAPMGHKYIAANSNGLYELDGDTDANTSIVSDMVSGLMQIGGSRFSSFKAAYLGIRGTGQFYFKLVSGDGTTYTYLVQANNMKTTRINLGKGLRARYFSYELTNVGQDFDLDSIEFVPIVAQRRV